MAAALIAAACVFGAVWYVPRIAAADGNSLSGTVTSSGVVYLNFSSSGQLGTITATIGQRVNKGHLLATEVAPATAAVLAADRAAITADKYVRVTVILASVLTTNLAILVLAGFIGFVVISKVPNTLHTPLMSGTNAIHGIVLLGGLLLFGLTGLDALSKALLVIAVAFGTEGGQFQGAGWSTVVCGPGSIEQAHKPDEFIERSQLSECEAFLERAVTLQCC